MGVLRAHTGAIGCIGLSCLHPFVPPSIHPSRKVLFGSMTVNSYTKPERISQMRPPYRCKFSSSDLVRPDSEPCVLYPDDGNIHEIKAHE